MKRRRTAAQLQASRRDFIKQSALVAGMGVWVASARPLWAAAEGTSKLEQLNFACIGVGGKGDGDSAQVAKHGNVLAICDIDDRILDKKQKSNKSFEKSERFNDFRKLFDKLGKNIDAVTISTPDHMHAAITVMAIKAGKHVYTQKPMTHDVYEARQLRLAAKEHKICSQMGNQGTAATKLREGVELIQAGILGDVTEVHIWTNRPVWPQAPKVVARPPAAEIPEGVHWPEWIGTAPMRPYAEYNEGGTGRRGKGAYHTFNWRGYWDFGTGALGDMGCHTANLPFMALRLQHPTSLHGDCGDLNPETYPAWAHVVYEFAARGNMPPVKVNWYEGKKDDVLVHPPKELVEKVLTEYRKTFKESDKAGLKKAAELNRSGSIIVGTKGLLYSPHDYGGDWALLPAEDFRDYKAPTPTLPRNNGADQGQKDEWVAAIKAGKPEMALANFDYAGMLTEFILLGNIAIANHGKRLEWDGPNMKFPNAPEAEKGLRRQYREGYTL